MRVIIGYGGHARMLLSLLNKDGIFAHIIATTDPVPDGVPVMNGLGNIPRIGFPGLHLRREIYKSYEPRVLGYLDKSALINGFIETSSHCMANVVINTNAIVHENCIINTGAIIEHDCVVGPHCHIAPGALLCGNVMVGDGTHIGAATVVLPGVVIGRDCMVAAGSVVTEDVPDGKSWLKGEII